MNVETLAKSFADYLNFIFDFARSPRQALQGYVATHRVSRELVWFAFVGVITSTLIVSITSLLKNGPELGPASAYLSAIVGNFNVLLAPVMFMAVFVIAMVVHGLAQLHVGRRHIRLMQPGDLGYLGGTIEDSVNAFLAFSAMFLPLSASFVTMILIVGAMAPGLAEIVVLPLSVAVGAISMLFHLPAALSTTHPRTSFREALFALLGALSTVVLLIVTVLRFAEAEPRESK